MHLSSLVTYPLTLHLLAIAAAHNDLSVQRDSVDVEVTESCIHCSEIQYLDLNLEKPGKAS